MSNQIKTSRFFAYFMLGALLLFTSFLCEDKEDEKLLPDTVDCNFKTINETRTAENTQGNQDPFTGFVHINSEEYGDIYQTNVVIENVCEDQDLNIKGAAFCTDGMCNGGFEWKVVAYINVDEYVYGPEEIECIGGKCEFDLWIPADYTSIASGTYKIEIEFRTGCGPNANCDPAYFDWKIDRLEVQVNYYEAS